MSDVKTEQNIPKEWQSKNFLDCVIIPTKINGLKKSEYKKSGQFPIFDQGQQYISGYTDRKDLVQKKVPAILFGDHTRIIKYIEKPYALGADGTKIFWASQITVPLFLYQVLLKLKIPNTGYNRHFKWLKEANINLPPLSEQKRIAEILNAIDRDIQKTDEIIFAIRKLKLGLKQKLFTQGIGHTKFKKTEMGKIPNEWEIVSLKDVVSFTTGKLNSNAAIEDGKYPFFTCSQETFKTNTYAFDQEAILLAGNNAVGKYSVKHFKGKFDAYQRTYVITILNENELNYVYFKEILEDKLEELRNSSFGSTTKFLTIKLLESLKMKKPPIKEQKEIAEILSSVDENISINQKIKEKQTLLKKGLMQDLLSGDKRVKV